MRAFLVGLAVSVSLAACSSSTDVTAGAKLSLDQHQAQWGQRTFSSYAFDLLQQKLGDSSNVHITVNGTTITSVIDNTTHAPPTVDVGYVTIDDLFATAQAAIGQKNTTLQMDFNQQYGYPTVLVVSSNNAASPYAAQVSNLTPVE